MGMGRNPHVIVAVAAVAVLYTAAAAGAGSHTPNDPRQHDLCSLDARGAARPFHQSLVPASSLMLVASSSVNKRNDEFKSNREWWLDPLSLFDDEEENEARQTKPPNDNQAPNDEHFENEPESEEIPLLELEEDDSYWDFSSENEVIDDARTPLLEQQNPSKSTPEFGYRISSEGLSSDFSLDDGKPVEDMQNESATRYSEQPSGDVEPQADEEEEGGLKTEEGNLKNEEDHEKDKNLMASNSKPQNVSSTEQAQSQKPEVAPGAAEEVETVRPASTRQSSPAVISFTPQISGNTAATTLLIFTACKSVFKWCFALFHQIQDDHGRKKTSDKKTTKRQLSQEPKESNRGKKGDEDGHDEAATRENDNDGERTKSEPRGWFGNLFDNKSSPKVRLPSPRVLNQQLEEMTLQFEEAQAGKEAVEKEYERTSWQLQETLTELNSLKTTTRHLQAQLADNESVMSRTLRAERRKAKEELLRMREAMVKVVEREREQMREEFMKQAAELQMLWKNQQEQRQREEHQQQYRNFSPPPTPPPPRTPPSRSTMPSAPRRNNDRP